MIFGYLWNLFKYFIEKLSIDVEVASREIKFESNLMPYIFLAAQRL